MNVIINEFEIITAPPPEPAGQESAAEPPDSEMAPPLSPMDMERVHYRHEQRMDRIHAN